jgi:hypothetical protein
MRDEDILYAVRCAVQTNIRHLHGDWWKGDPCRHVGALTTQVSFHLGLTAEKTRRKLARLVSLGKIQEHKTPGGITRWHPTP